MTIVVAIGSVVLHASQRSHGTRTDTSLVIFTLGSLTSLLLLYRVLIVLPQASKVIDQKLGAILGLACAFGIALGGFESIPRAANPHAGGFAASSPTDPVGVRRWRAVDSGGARAVAMWTSAMPAP